MCSKQQTSNFNTPKTKENMSKRDKVQPMQYISSAFKLTQT